MATKTRPNQNEIKRQIVNFELKAASAVDGFAGEFEGYAAGILNVDSVGDMIVPGAFTDDLPRFLGEGAVCWNHNWDQPIGKPLEAKEDQYGLFVKARVSKTQTGEEVMTLLRDGVVKKMSIGYRVKEYEWMDRAGLVSYLSANYRDKAASILQQYDERDLSEVFLIKKLKLYEFSPVTFPANNNANITSAKGLESLAGLTFAEHSEAVHAAVKSYAERAQKISDLRAKDNRTLSDERLSDLETIADGLKLALSQLDGLLKPPTAKNADASLLFAEHLRSEARRLGCAV